jgi:hypothetical protein
LVRKPTAGCLLWFFFSLLKSSEESRQGQD